MAATKGKVLEIAKQVNEDKAIRGWKISLMVYSSYKLTLLAEISGIINGHFLKTIIGDFWSTDQKHNAQFLKHKNGLMPKIYAGFQILSSNSFLCCHSRSYYSYIHE